MEFTLRELAVRTGSRLVGDAGTVITGVAPLASASAGDITFLANPRYRNLLETTRAAAVIVVEAEVAGWRGNALVARNPHATFARVAALFVPEAPPRSGIHATASIEAEAVIAPTASIGAGAFVGAGTVIEAGVIVGPGCVVMEACQVGENSRLVANVTIYPRTVIGKRALIHAGAVLGGDGFGFARENGSWLKVPQLGRVRLGDDVEIGASSTVDRGAIEDTVIGDGVKIDNLVQVAHNVRIGDHTVVAGCTGIAGSAVVGSHCAIGGGVGIVDHVTIADGVTVTATSFVAKSIRTSGVYSSGVPLEPADSWHKNYARFKQLDEMARRLMKLERELQELKEKG